MRKRAIRFAVLALLLVLGLGTALLVWDTSRRIAATHDRDHDLEARFDRMSAAVASLGMAQRSYVAPGQSAADWLARASGDLQDLRDDAAGLRERAQSAGAVVHLRAFATALASAAATDERVREHLRIGHELMASDLLYSEAREALDAMTVALAEAHAAERAHAAAEPYALAARAAMLIAMCAAAWVAGLIALTPVPRLDRPAAQVAESDAGSAGAGGERAEAAAAAPRLEASPALAAAAEICVELCGLTSATGLPPLLERTARLIEAPGLIVWLGAGEELFVAVAYGYPESVLARLGPIRREAENATAAAWRTGRLQTVSGDATGTGAIVSPLFGPGGVLGVLAAEVPRGGERDEAARGVLTIVAAQLASIVAAWPAASADQPALRAVDAAAEDGRAATAATA